MAKNNNKIFTNKESMKQAIKDHRKTIGDMYGSYIESIYKKEHGLSNSADLSKDQEFFKFREEYINTIAPLDINSVNNFVDFSNKATSIVKGREYYQKKALTTPVENEKEKLSTMIDFFNVVSGKVTDSGSGIHRTALKNSIDYQASYFKGAESIQYAKKIRENLKSFISPEGKIDKAVFFDLETLGGTNAHNQQQLFGITEFTFNVLDKDRNLTQYSNLIGITKSQKIELEERVERAKTQGIVSNEDAVFFDRLYKYGHSESELKNVGKGEWKAVLTDKNFSDEYDFDVVKKGIEKLYKVGQEQEIENVSKIAKPYEQMISAIKEMTGKNTIVGGHNIQMADENWLNRSFMKAPEKVQQELKNILGNSMKLEIAPEKQIDTLRVANLYSAIANKNDLYSSEVLKNLKDEGLSTLKQESLIRQFFPSIFESGAAHAAEKDVEGSSLLILGNDNTKSPTMSMLDEINSFFNDKNSTVFNNSIVGNRQELFINDNTIFMDDFFKKGGLSFTKDSLSGEYITFGGKAMDAEGNVFSGVKQTLKKNMTYTIGSKGRVDIDANSEMSKAIESLYPEYNQGSLYFAEFVPVFNKDVKGAMENSALQSPTYLLATSEKELQDVIGGMTLIGKANDKYNADERVMHTDGYDYIKNKTIQDKIESRYRQYKIQDGQLEVYKEASVENIINEGTSTVIREGAARQVRKDSYKTAVAFNELLGEVSKKTGLEKETVSFDSAREVLDNALDVSQKIVRTKKHNLMALNEQSENASKAILKSMRGEAINAGAIPIDAIFSYNYKGQQIPYSNTINNVIANFDYFAAQNNISQHIIKEIDKMDPDHSFTSQQKEYMYQQLLNETKGKIASSLTNDETKKELVKNAELAPVYGKDLNFIELNLGKDFFQKRDKGIHTVTNKVGNEIDENIIRINLNNKGGGLINSLLRKNYGNLSNANKDEAATYQLGRLIKFLKEDENYSEYFKDFSVNFGGDAHDLNTFSFVNDKKLSERLKEFKEKNNRNPNKQELQAIKSDSRVNAFEMPTLSLSEEVMFRLKKAKKDNPALGLVNDVYRQNTIEDGAYVNVLKAISKNKEAEQELKGYISDKAKDLPSLMSVKSFNAREFVQSNLIEDGLRDEFTNAAHLVKKYGYSKERAEQLVSLYNRTEKSLTGIISNYVEEMSKMNVDFVWNSKNKKAGLLHDGKGVVLDSIPQIKSHNGTMYVQVGRNEISLNSVLSFKNDQFVLDTTLDKAYKNMAGSFRTYAKNGVENNDRLMAAVSAMQGFAKEVRNGSSVDRHDLIDRQSNFVLDYSELIENLHTMFESGKFNNTPVMDSKAISLLQKEGVSANRIFAGDKELFGDAIYDIFDVVAKNSSKEVKDFLKQNLHSLKDVQVSEQKSVFGGVPVTPWWQLVNQQRPPLNQIPRAVTMDEAVWEKNYNKLKSAGVLSKTLDKHIQKEAYVHNRETLNFYRQYDPLSKTYSNIGFNALQLDSSELQVKALLNMDYNKKLGKQSKVENRKLEKIHNVLMTTNLYEQEEIVDARVASTVFHELDYQKVSARKDLIFELNNADLTRQQMEDLKGKILPKFKVENGELKVVLQKEGKLVKRYDPIINVVGFGNSVQPFGVKDDIGTLKFGFFKKNGLLASQDELNAVLKESGIKVGDMTPEVASKAYKILDEKYDAAFFVQNGLDNGYFKLGHSMSEKSMAYAPMFGLGQYNDRLGKSIRELADKELQKGTGITFESISGKVIRGDLVDITAKRLVEEGKYKTIEEARRDILKEKYAPSQYLFDTVLKGAGGLNGERIFSITNHAINKHENINIPVEDTVNLLIDSLKNELGNDMSKIVDYEHDGASIRKALKLGNGIDIVDNKIVFKDSVVQGGTIDNYVDVKMLEKLAKHKKLTWTDAKGNEHLGLAFQKDGVVFGTVKKQYMNKVNDYDKISSNKVEVYQKELKELASKYGLDSPEYEKAAYKIQERMRIQNALQRGTKVTDREIMMMNFKKADSAFDFLQQNLSKEEFLTSASHLIKKDTEGNYLKDKSGKYIIDETAKNESLLGYFTNRIKDQLFLSKKDLEEGNTLYSALNSKNGSKSYTHLQGIAKEFNNGRGISLRKAEEMYSLSQGFKAMDFNAGNLDIDFLTKNGFSKPVSINKLSFSLGQDASYNLSNPNSFYNKSMIIDLGFEKQLGKENRYLAIPQMPVRKNGEELAKYEFQSDINRLYKARQRVVDALEGKKEGVASENYNRALQQYQDIINQTKEHLSKNITAKNGMLHSAVSVKMDKSVAGKASAIVLGTPEDIENISDKALKGLIKNTNASLEQKGKATLSNALVKAEYKGKSLANLYKEGHFVDAKFMGQEAFERLGFFEKSYMDKIGIKSVDEMKHLLSTKGTMGITGRYPTIYPESFKPTMMYLNEALHGMRMQLTAEGQLSAFGDNDGDNTTSFLLEVGKKKYDYLAAQMHRDNKMNKQVAENFKKDYNKAEKRAFKNAETLIDYNAAGINQFYHKQIMETLNKDLADAINNDLITVTGSKRLDNKVYAAFGLGAGSAKDFKHHKDAYDNIEKQVLEKLGASSRGEVKSEEFLKEADNIISSMNNKSQAEKYKKAVVFNEAWLADKKAMMAKSKKSSIGAANIPLFNLRKIGELFIDAKDQDRDLKKDIIQHFSTMIEQDVISTKKATVLQNVDRTNQFVTSFNKLIYGGKKEDARKWLSDISDKEFSTIAEKMHSNMSKEQLTETFLNVVSNFSTQNKEALSALRHANKLAQGIFGVSQENIIKSLNGMPTNNDLMLNTYINRARKAGLYMGSGLSEETIKASVKNKSKRDKLKLIDGRERLERESNNASREFKQILEGTGKAVASATSKVSGKGLAIGALGIAGSFLVSGFVGGNPMRPADNHAADEAQGEYNNRADFAVTQSLHQRTPQQGYIININASAPKGRQQAIQAVHNAVSQSVPTDINISMNINDNNGNISDRDIEKMLSGVIH